MTTKEKMNSSKKTARIVGVLFITATVASSLSIVILSPILDAPDYLISVSANEYQVIMAVLFMLIDVVQLLASQL
jgi:type IV secretory pathway component VirB8